MSALDINNPKFPLIEEENEDSEKHLELDDESIKSNVVGYEHPLFSSSGVVSLLNRHINTSNTEEKERSGEVKDEVFNNIAKAVSKTKVSYVLLLTCVDWKEKITERSGASDSFSIANELISASRSLKSTLGRDPTYGEMFLRFVSKSDSKVQEVYKRSVEKPEEEAPDLKSDKDDIVMFKKRGKTKQKRTNRELYDYFYKRCIQGKLHFMTFLGKDINGNQ